MLKLKRAAGHIEVELGEFTLYLTYEQAKTLGNHLIMMSSTKVLEITLEPDQYRNVSEDGSVNEPSERPFNVPPMQGE